MPGPLTVQEAAASLAGALFTGVALLLLALGGALLAYRALGSEAHRDRAALAAGTVLGALAQAVGLGLLLGALGHLRAGTVVGAEAALVLGLVALNRRALRAGDFGAAYRALAAGVVARLREHWVLALLVGHVVLAGFLRGALRPPLSWDSLMYHLLLAGHWLQAGAIEPFYGPYPLNFDGLLHANGSVWLWWWMAPSRSDLYVNLAGLPPLALACLSAAGVARELGARRSSALAGLLVPVVPVVAHFAATQYVDILAAALGATALFFTLRWLARPRLGLAVFAGLAAGLAAGTKGLVLPSLGALAASVAVALARPGRGEARARLVGLLGAATAALALGGYFYLRNHSLGLGLLFPQPTPLFGSSIPCDPPLDNPILRAGAGSLSLWRNLAHALESGDLVETLVGTPWVGARELGLGPAGLVVLATPFALAAFAAEGTRRAASFVAVQALVVLLVFTLVPIATHRYLLGNARFLDLGLVLGVAALFALLERRGARAPLLTGAAVLVAAQSVVLLRVEVPTAARLLLVGVDALALALVLAPRARGWLARRGRSLSVAGAVAGLALVPLWVHARDDDRARAFAEEYEAHGTPAHWIAPAWSWLDVHGGRGTVAVVSEPQTYFAYPAMGRRLERRVVYVNPTREDHRSVAAYPNCNPRHARAAFDEEAWVRNLRRQGVRWVLLSKLPGGDELPIEDAWARHRPELALRFADARNRLYELAGDHAR